MVADDNILKLILFTNDSFFPMEPRHGMILIYRIITNTRITRAFLQAERINLRDVLAQMKKKSMRFAVLDNKRLNSCLSLKYACASIGLIYSHSASNTVYEYTYTFFWNEKCAKFEAVTFSFTIPYFEGNKQ